MFTKDDLTLDICRDYYAKGYLSSPPLVKEYSDFKHLTWLPFRWPSDGKTRFFCKEWIEEMLSWREQ